MDAAVRASDIVASLEAEFNIKAPLSWETGVANDIRAAEQASYREGWNERDAIDLALHPEIAAARQDERRKVLEEIVEWHQKQVDDLDASGFQQLGVAHRKAVDHFRALAEEVT